MYVRLFRLSLAHSRLRLPRDFAILCRNRARLVFCFHPSTREISLLFFSSFFLTSTEPFLAFVINPRTVKRGTVHVPPVRISQVYLLPRITLSDAWTRECIGASAIGSVRGARVSRNDDLRIATLSRPTFRFLPASACLCATSAVS